MQVCWLSDRGLERENNEDAWGALPGEGLAFVSDGMGGEAAGELASRRVVEWLPSLLAEHLGPTEASDPHAVKAAVADAVRTLNYRIRAEASGLGGVARMGATLTMVLFVERHAYVAHVGDSRAYLLRDGRLRRLTRDHSVVGTLVERGIITPEQAANHPMRGQLVRYVGMGGDAGPDVAAICPQGGDLILLCTDGLTAEVGDAQIREMILGADGMAEACHALVDAANRAGGFDNTTVMLVRRTA
jgi:protein phosphatase